MLVPEPHRAIGTMARLDESGKVGDFSFIAFKLNLPNSDVIISTGCS